MCDNKTSKPKNNIEIYDAIQKHMMSNGMTKMQAAKIMWCMSMEDLTCYYEENCK